MIFKRLKKLEEALANKDKELNDIINSPVVKVALEQAALAAKKQADLDRMTTHGLNYDIIRELINSAIHGVDISIRFNTGEILKIERTEEYKKLQNKFQSELF